MCCVWRMCETKNIPNTSALYYYHHSHCAVGVSFSCFRVVLSHSFSFFHYSMNDPICMLLFNFLITILSNSCRNQSTHRAHNSHSNVPNNELDIMYVWVDSIADSFFHNRTIAQTADTNIECAHNDLHIE